MRQELPSRSANTIIQILKRDPTYPPDLTLAIRTLQGILQQRGVTRDKRVICYCGGGISATIDLFLLHQLGYENLTLYDASMGEWAKDASLPIETDRP